MKASLFCCLAGNSQPESPREEFTCAKELLQSSTRTGEGLAEADKSDTCLVVVADDGRLALLGHEEAMEISTVRRSSVLVNLQDSLDVGASAGLPVTGQNFRRWRECTTASVASIQRLSPSELIATLQARLQPPSPACALRLRVPMAVVEAALALPVSACAMRGYELWWRLAAAAWMRPSFTMSPSLACNHSSRALR